jgi:hypothetical protein
MLRMYMVQQCFGLSDEGMEDVIYDSQAIRRFIGIDLIVDTAPDATTLLKFRRLLETHRAPRKTAAGLAKCGRLELDVNFHDQDQSVCRSGARSQARPAW